ncbi:LysR family transcriptional regulator [Lampropedia puyangensis]|uniref:LysR family transcriptional regulator n=1 Tax=Lampropedia puyangensis TaxID=1330072 RepID=A0A4S8ESV3_9BURK|nr:LysR substrate-binding domain-containing protein [Lampropedia puyangensis]THT97959.1 LysR family transcriptional regulator [Lampropedia puyangensis]
MSENYRLSRHLSLTTLELFIAVCETGSIAQAAEREFIAPSAVSKRLSDLEGEVGVVLLERHSRGVKPTPAGESFLQHARSILHDVGRLHSDLQEYAEGVRGHVRVHANLSAIVQFLPEDLGLFAQQQPAIKIDLQERMSYETLQAVQEGAVELGICYTPGAAPTGLQSRPYHRDRLMVVMPTKHPLNKTFSEQTTANSHAPEIAFAEVLDFDLVGLNRQSSIGLLMRQAAAATGKGLRQRIQVTGLDTMCRMIDNGLGIGVMPDRAFALMQPLGNLAAIPLSDPWSWRQSWMIARDFTSLPAATQLLVSHLEEQAQHQTRLRNKNAAHSSWPIPSSPLGGHLQ